MSWLKEAGLKPIKDRGIRWKERYKLKSEKVKKHMEKILPGSYFRWEGHDYYSGSDYYVIVGPSISRRYGKSFFAGHKKLPKERKKKAYAPSGKYFPSMVAALRHAKMKWGITFPKDFRDYKKQDLIPIKIPRHLKG